MLKATALILLVAVSLHISSTCAKSTWAKRESIPAQTVIRRNEDISNLVDSAESDVSSNKSKSDDSDDDEIDTEFLKDFLYVISKVASSDDSDEEDEAEVTKAFEDFKKKHPDAEKFWKLFLGWLAIMEDSSEESSESTKSKRSFARFSRRANVNGVTDLHNIF